jgi:hypothetical protein
MIFQRTVAIVFALSVAALDCGAHVQRWTPSYPELSPAVATSGGISFLQSPVPQTPGKCLKLYCRVFVDSVSVAGGSDSLKAGSLPSRQRATQQGGTFTYTSWRGADISLQPNWVDSGGVSLPGTSQRLSWPQVVILFAISLATYLSRIFRKPTSKKPAEP